MSTNTEKNLETILNGLKTMKASHKNLKKIQATGIKVTKKMIRQVRRYHRDNEFVGMRSSNALLEYVARFVRLQDDFAGSLEETILRFRQDLVKSLPKSARSRVK